VNDLLRSTQRCESFRTKQAVRVRDDADEDGSLPNLSRKSVWVEHEIVLGEARKSFLGRARLQSCRPEPIDTPALASAGARGLSIRYPLAAHQLVHFLMRRRTFHQLVRAGSLYLLGKPAQESQRRPHRTRT
jgi:hypothetical protein